MAKKSTAEVPLVGVTLIHHTSTRVTASISLHRFHACREAAVDRWFRPTQHLTLQFPEDLDPIGGPLGLSEQDRRCTFTPCRLGNEIDSGNTYGETIGGKWSLSVLTRNGRITGLLGLPRPYRTLTAEVVEVGGGFPLGALNTGNAEMSPGAFLCIAGGTGIAPFLTLEADTTRRYRLFWSVRGDDFGVVEFALDTGLLHLEAWEAVTVFVTAAEDSGGLNVDRSPAWWQERFSALRQQYPVGFRLEKRRITADDMTGSMPGHGNSSSKILFCGGKSLEWQVKMWSMGSATVYCTDMS